MIIRILLAIAMFAAPTFGADEHIREGAPKSCFLFSWGKGPNWKTDVRVEFQRHYLNLKRPYIDDRFSDPTPDALTWIDRTVAPNISEIARVDSRIVLRVDYPIDGKFGRDTECVMLAIETERDSGWFAPFFAAQPELFEGHFVSSESVRIGYIATLAFSGTGALRTHYLFDLTGAHPAVAGTTSAGRVRSVDFDTDAEYQEALKTFDLEAKLLNGESVEPVTESKTKPNKAEQATPRKPSDQF